MTSHNSQGLTKGYKSSFFLLGRYASRKRLGTAALELMKSRRRRWNCLDYVKCLRPLHESNIVKLGYNNHGYNNHSYNELSVITRLRIVMHLHTCICKRIFWAFLE